MPWSGPFCAEADSRRGSSVSHSVPSDIRLGAGPTIPPRAGRVLGKSDSGWTREYISGRMARHMCGTTVVSVETGWARLRGLDLERPWVLDTALALALLVASVLAASEPAPGSRVPDATLYALLILGCLPYPWRRRAPVPVLLLASLPVLAIIGLGYSSAVVGSGLFLLAYTVAARCSARTTAFTGLYVALMLAVVAAMAPNRMPLAELATNAALFVGALGLGRGAHLRLRNTALLAERAELAERAREEEAARAVSEERLRIAREMHDVVGHTMGVIALQAGVGAHVIDSDRDEAKAALLSIAQTSRSALAEIRQILGALRNQQDVMPVRPTPGLAALPDLAGELAAAGLPVRVQVYGDPTGVPTGVDVTAYRVVQESLTNVLRHAGRATAEVHVGYEPEAIVLEIIDDGSGLGADAGGGHGQIGMRERVAVWGGTLDAGPQPEGGYRVAARLPYQKAGSS
jgi:signal transduction histidine kinase